MINIEMSKTGKMTKTIAKVGDNTDLELTNVISLKQFPPKLRKVAKYMLQNDKPVTIIDACKAVNVNYGSMRAMIYVAKKKGNDFNEFIDQEAQAMLRASKVSIHRALVNGAVLDSHQDRKLYYQLTGDLKEEANITVNNLTIGINIEGSKPADTRKPKTVLDVQAIIPDKD